MREAVDKLRRSTHARLIAWKLALVVALALAVSEASYLVHIDLAVNQAVHDSTVGWLTAAVTGITDMASTHVVLALTALGVILLVAVGHLRGALALGLSVLGTQVVVAIVKAIVSRPRPDAELSIIDPSGYSFPSGHSASAVALYITLALVAASIWRPRWRVAAFVAAGLLVALVGLSRIYLGAHYPTDVLAGWLTGGILVALAWRLSSRLPSRARLLGA